MATVELARVFYTHLCLNWQPYWFTHDDPTGTVESLIIQLFMSLLLLESHTMVNFVLVLKMAAILEAILVVLVGFLLQHRESENNAC